MKVKIFKIHKGVEPGTIVVTEEALNGLFEPEYNQVNCYNIPFSLVLF
jgi:hypothetical protein